MSEKHPAAIQFWVPRSEPRTGSAGGDVACGHIYMCWRRGWQYCKSIRNPPI